MAESPSLETRLAAGSKPLTQKARHRLLAREEKDIARRLKCLKEKVADLDDFKMQMLGVKAQAEPAPGGQNQPPADGTGDENVAPAGAPANQ